MSDFKKEVVQIGAGKIGRGYVAELFYAAGYKITFLDYSKQLVDSLNEQGWYTISKRHPDATFSKIIVKGYDAYCTETDYEKCVEALASTNYASINVYPLAVPSIGHMIGDAIKLRIKHGNNTTLDCIIGVNFLNSSRMFRAAAQQALSTEQELSYLENNVGFIEGLVGRNGAPPTPEMLAEDPLICNSSDAESMTIDRDTFKGCPPEGVNFILKENVPAWMVNKIWVANMGHCLRALFGYKKGYTYIGECDDDPYIAKCGQLAAMEAQFAMHEEYGLSYQAMEEQSPLEKRRENYLNHTINAANKDTITRVCADMIRKLGKEDRLIGPALGAISHGRVPYFLSRGAAMGFHYADMNDPTVVEIQGYLKENGIERAVEKYCGLSDSIEAEKRLKQLIISQYYEIGDFDPFDLQY